MILEHNYIKIYTGICKELDEDSTLSSSGKILVKLFNKTQDCNQNHFNILATNYDKHITFTVYNIIVHKLYEMLSFRVNFC